MATFPDGIVSDEEAKKIYVARSKSVDEKTVSANNNNALLTKVKGEEQDGWLIARNNKKSVRMHKQKPQDRQLEDDVWSLLYKLGFKELNSDRNFLFPCGADVPGRQIDVYAKDEETVFIVECTCAQENKTKQIKGLIDKINGIRENVIKSIHTHYGKDPKLKVKWAIATRNIDWRKADKDRAAESKIAVITEQDIAYYLKLSSFLKEAARYQFLARYLKGEGIDGLKIELPATRGKMGSTSFYNFLISPYDLLKISYISHKATSSNDLDTYQRMVKPSRLKDISSYIDNGGQFPTNIVINFKTNSSLSFKPSEKFGNCTFGKLTLPGQYGSAWIIDGQHRLYGFAFAKRGMKHVVPVLAYENLPPADEMKLFVDINCEQVKVSRSLLNEIYATLNNTSDDPIERLEAQYPRIALRLDEMPDSPIRDRVLTSSKNKDSNRCLTLTSLADGIRENGLLGSITSSSKSPPIHQPGALCDLSGDLELTTEKAADVLAGYFRMFALGVPGNWQLGDAKGGFLCTNNGLRALLRLLKELIKFFEQRDHIYAYTLDADHILEKLTPFVSPLVSFFQNADPSEIQGFRSRQALDGVKKNSFGMMGIICEAVPGFTNKELQEYLSSRDKEGTNEARKLIDDINLILHSDVIAKLKEHYGETKEAWWWQGIPQATREKCDAQVNRDNGLKERWQYLSLADYQTIIPNTWVLFEDKYDFFGKGKKAEKVSWIGRLNKIRQTTHHPEKGLISKDEVTFVKEIHSKVMARIHGKS